MRLVLIFLAIWCMTSCGNKQTEVQPQSQISGQQDEISAKKSERESNKAKAKEDMIARLMQNYMAFPATQEQKDEKKIIDFAIANELDMKRTDSGLYFMYFPTGRGKKLELGDAIRVQYTGYFLNGKVLESTLNSGGPASFSVGSTIKGWNEMLLMMNMGDKAKVIIPSHLAYGKRGQGETIPPYTPLFFDIEVMGWVKDKMTERKSEIISSGEGDVIEQ